MKKTGSLIVVSGPSGVGKSTLVNQVRHAMPELEFSVSCTTRAPRAGECHGREYFFLAEPEFEQRLAAGEFLEHAGIFAHRYGTLRSEVVRRLERGATVLLDIDVQGARQIRAAAASDHVIGAAALFVMIAPPTEAVLTARLRGRASDSEEQIKLRLAAARAELENFRLYDYVVVNDNLDSAVTELESIFRSAALRTPLIDGGLFDE